MKLLKEQLRKHACTFITVPKHLELKVEDFSQNEANFIWATDDLEDGIAITLDLEGNLLSFTKPATLHGPIKSLAEQQVIAESFLTEQYNDAPHFLSLSKTLQKEDETRFIFEQFVGGYPLASFYTRIVVSTYGEITEFHYNGYTDTPPSFPIDFADKEGIFEQLRQANWAISIQYLNHEQCSVSTSGLYAMYVSPIVYQSFDAITGETNSDEDDYDEDVYLPFPKVSALNKYDTLEKIIGVDDSMEKLREVETEDEICIVWRDKNWKSTADKTFDSFLFERIEETIKAKKHKETGKLTGFVCFKEVFGELKLTFEACQNIAATFIATYFDEYVPYLKLKYTEPFFSESHRAVFTFLLHDGQGNLIDGETFLIGVNRTTGKVETLMTPKIDMKTIQDFDSSSIQPLEHVLSALSGADAFLKWQRNYDEANGQDILQYKIGLPETKQRILGIDAVSGKLIFSKL